MEKLPNLGDGLSDTLSKHIFIQRIFPSTSSPTPSPSSPPPSSAAAPSSISMSYRKSLEELSKEIKEIEDFITVTEDILRRERERDREFYARERQRRRDLQRSQRTSASTGGNKENRTPVTVQIYSANSAASTTNATRSLLRKCKSASPKSVVKRRHQFRSGRVSCISVDGGGGGGAPSGVINTEDLVRRIVRLNSCDVNVDCGDERASQCNYEFLSNQSFDDDSIVEATKNGGGCKRMSRDGGEGGIVHSFIDSSTEDNLEMVIVEAVPSIKGANSVNVIVGGTDGDGTVEMDYGLIEGFGHGVELTRSATMPSSASSGQSNAT